MPIGGNGLYFVRRVMRNRCFREEKMHKAMCYNIL